MLCQDACISQIDECHRKMIYVTSNTTLRYINHPRIHISAKAGFKVELWITPTPPTVLVSRIARLFSNRPRCHSHNFPMIISSRQGLPLSLALLIFLQLYNHSTTITYHPHLYQQNTQLYDAALLSSTVTTPVVICYTDNRASFAVLVHNGSRQTHPRLSATTQGYRDTVITGGPVHHRLLRVPCSSADQASQVPSWIRERGFLVYKRT